MLGEWITDFPDVFISLSRRSSAEPSMRANTQSKATTISESRDSGLGPRCSTLFISHLLANFAEATRNVRRLLLRLSRLHHLLHARNVLRLGQRRLVGRVVLQIASAKFTAKPRPKLFNWIQIWAAWWYFPQRETMPVVNAIMFD